MSRLFTSLRRPLVFAGLVVVIGVAFWRSGPIRAQNKTEELRYSHEGHEKLGVKHDRCDSCHNLEEDYTVRPPTQGRNHQPCADSDCHAKEYFSRDPKICVVCHTDTRPWIKQKAELKKHGTSEFGGDLSHKTHATARVGGSGANGPCKKCHGDPYQGTPARGGHDDCAPCHGKTTKPAMADCGSCHRLGARKARSSAKVSDWSVAMLFAHNTHGRDPRPSKSNSETECTTCHATITSANKLAEVENPAMKSCDTCHDGKSAFKTTGFQCYRCHADSGPEAPPAK